jgi:hypothetical protein
MVNKDPNTPNKRIGLDSGYAVVSFSFLLISMGVLQRTEGKWLGGRDSNPDTQIQSLQSYH